MTGFAVAATVRRVTVAGVMALSAAGFTMSFDALHRPALRSGVPSGLAWMWPLVVDGFIVIVAVVHAAASGTSTVHPWLLLSGFSTLSVGFNVARAGVDHCSSGGADPAVGLGAGP